MDLPERMICCYVQHPQLKKLTENIANQLGLALYPISSPEEILEQNDHLFLWLIVELNETQPYANEKLERRYREKFSIPILFLKVNPSETDPEHPIEIRIALPNDPTDYLHNILQNAGANSNAYLGCGRREELEKKYNKLSTREKEVFGLVSKGKHNKEIAHLLNISKRTVELHRSHILRKMKMDSFTALACTHISDLV